MSESTILDVGKHYTFTDPYFGEFTGRVLFSDSVFLDVKLASDVYCEGELYRKSGEKFTLSAYHIKAKENGE